MIFKRKEPKPPGVGMICRINPTVLDKMMAEESYKLKSVSHLNEINNSYISDRSLNKSLALNNQIMCADQELLYVYKSSHFKGLVEVIPLAVRRDSSHAPAIRSLLYKGKTFLMRLESLQIASPEHIKYSATNYYSDNNLNHIKLVINSKAIYNNPEFLWPNN
jgi:hypothetical protein